MIHLNLAQHYALPCEADELIQLRCTQIQAFCLHNCYFGTTTTDEQCTAHRYTLRLPVYRIAKNEFTISIKIYRYILHNRPGEPMPLPRWNEPNTISQYTRSHSAQIAYMFLFNFHYFIQREWHSLEWVALSWAHEAWHVCIWYLASSRDFCNDFFCCDVCL